MGFMIGRVPDLETSGPFLAARATLYEFAPLRHRTQTI
jgi:hypothetical protein